MILEVNAGVYQYTSRWRAEQRAELVVSFTNRTWVAHRSPILGEYEPWTDQEEFR